MSLQGGYHNPVHRFRSSSHDDHRTSCCPGYTCQGRTRNDLWRCRGHGNRGIRRCGPHSQSTYPWIRSYSMTSLKVEQQSTKDEVSLNHQTSITVQLLQWSHCVMKKSSQQVWKTIYWKKANRSRCIRCTQIWRLKRIYFNKFQKKFICVREKSTTIKFTKIKYRRTSHLERNCDSRVRHIQDILTCHIYTRAWCSHRPHTGTGCPDHMIPHGSHPQEFLQRHKWTQTERTPR